MATAVPRYHAAGGLETAASKVLKWLQRQEAVSCLASRGVAKQMHNKTRIKRDDGVSKKVRFCSN